MASLMHTVADGVCALLAAGTFTVPVTPQVSYETEMVLEGLTGLRCDVVPATGESELASRDVLQYTFGIDVGLRKKFAASDIDTDGKVKSSSMAAMIELLEDIHEYLASPSRRCLGGTYADAVWQGSTIRFLWVPAHLHQNHQYTGVFRATYAVDVDE